MNAYELLPHKYPFALLDRVEITEEAVAGIGYKEATASEEYARDTCSLFQVFVIEAMAQLSGIVSGQRGGGVLAGVKDFEYISDIRPGQRLVIESRSQGSFAGLYVFYCEAKADGEIAARGRVILRLS